MSGSRRASAALGTARTVLLAAALAALSAGGGRGLEEAEATVVPVAILGAPAAASAAVPVVLDLAPGELPRGGRLIVEEAGASLPVEPQVLLQHDDGSAARVRFVAPPHAAPTGVRRLLCRLPQWVDPAVLYPPAASASALGGSLPGVEVVAGGVPSLLPAKPTDPGPPAWWPEVKVRLSSELDPDDFAAQLDFVRAAYAEKGRSREAIRLLTEIAGRAEGRDEHSRLRALYEIAQLYEVFLHDFPRALDGYLACYRFPLANSTERRQNRIAAGFGCARSVAGSGERRRALVLYRLLARDLLLDPDPYGGLVLPEVFLRIGDTARGLGRTADARAAYRAATACADRLPREAPVSARAPGTSAQAALRDLAGEAPPFPRVADGTYSARAFGYNAPVVVRMRFLAGRLVELHLDGFGDKRPLDAYRIVPERILAAQSLRVDAVTGATVTSRGILSAATEAVSGRPEAGGSDGH